MLSCNISVTYQSLLLIIIYYYRLFATYMLSSTRTSFGGNLTTRHGASRHSRFIRRLVDIARLETGICVYICQFSRCVSL